MPHSTLEGLFAILEEIQDSTEKLRDVLIEADNRDADIAKQDGTKDTKRN